MSDPTSPYHPAIDGLEKDAQALERQWNEVVGAINVLRAKAGLPPRPGSGLPFSADAHANTVAADTNSVPPAQIRSDTFFGKRMGTAAREFLEMRRVGGLGAAKAREVFEGLKAGGFQFETKDDTNAIISVRNMLSKRSEMFQRLPNSTYGLRAWYPHAKQPKAHLAPETEKSEASPTAKTAEAERAAATAA